MTDTNIRHCWRPYWSLSGYSHFEVQPTPFQQEANFKKERVKLFHRRIMSPPMHTRWMEQATVTKMPKLRF